MSIRKSSVFLACLLALAFCLGGCQSDAPTPASAQVSTSAAVVGDIDGRYIREVFPELDTAKDIQYGEAVNDKGETQKLLLDVYQPKGDTAKSRAAVIFVHGGGFTGGDKGGGIEAVLAKILARKGYVTLSINYRLRTNPSADWVGTFRDSADDAYAAFQWLMQHKNEYRIDTSHIAFGGHSAGSNIVTELCYSDWSGRPIKKDNVFACISMAGPEMIFGNPKANDPFDIIIHGELDELVPCSGSENLARRMDAIGTPNVLNVIPECYHDQTPAIDEVEDVVTQYLYLAMTGRDAGVQIRRYADEIANMYADRMKQRPTYRAAKIAVTLDGKLDEWGSATPLPLNQIKDAGDELPSPGDCTATGMMAWDPDRPGCLFAALTVTDDVFQEDGNPNFWENDSIELLVDVTDNNCRVNFMQWVANVSGKEVNYVHCNQGSCEYFVTRTGNTATFEVMVDLTKALPELNTYSLAGKTIGFCLCYDDCEEGARQHQVGLVAGSTLNPRNFANLEFK